MAVGRSIHVGGSYGRAQAVVVWALDNWEDFDAWCCIKGIDPFELPAHRMYNLAIFALKEGKTEEQLEALESELRRCDAYKHPIKDMTVLRAKYFKATPTTKKVEPEPEEPRRYVPSWYKGEAAAAKIALVQAKAMPKSLNINK